MKSFCFRFLLLLPFAAWLVSCDLDPKKAREELSQKGIEFKEDDFLKAVRAGDREQVGLFLAAGMNPNAGEKDQNALMLASTRGYGTIVKMLVCAGADVNAQDDTQNTPLMMAATYGHLEVVKILIHDGALVNAVEEDGRTALMMAATEGHDNVIRKLISKGADLNLKDKVGMTAFLWAALEGRTKIVERLADRGADPNARDADGRTALMLAAWKGRLDTAQFLLKNGADLEAKDTQLGRDAAAWAAMGNHPEMLDILRAEPGPVKN